MSRLTKLNCFAPAGGSSNAEMRTSCSIRLCSHCDAVQSCSSASDVHSSELRRWMRRGGPPLLLLEAPAPPPLALLPAVGGVCTASKAWPMGRRLLAFFED